MNKLSTCLISGLMALSSQYANAITINFDYTFDSGFFSRANLSRRTVLNAAGALFENRLTDQLTAISSTGGNHFNANFNSPSDGVFQTINDFNVAADSLVVFVGARNFGGNILGQGGNGGFTASGTSQAFRDNLNTRGQAASDFGPWGGAMAFNSTSSWYFDSDVNTVESFNGQNDFYSVAIHELGHVLGYGSAHASHWAEGTMSSFNGVPQEAAMDPTLTIGSRKYFTDLDFQGLRDIGWQVSAVPVPAAVYLLASAMLSLIGFRRKD